VWVKRHGFPSGRVHGDAWAARCRNASDDHLGSDGTSNPLPSASTLFAQIDARHAGTRVQKASDFIVGDIFFSRAVAHASCRCASPSPGAVLVDRIGIKLFSRCFSACAFARAHRM